VDYLGTIPAPTTSGSSYGDLIEELVRDIRKIVDPRYIGNGVTAIEGVKELQLKHALTSLRYWTNYCACVAYGVTSFSWYNIKWDPSTAYTEKNGLWGSGPSYSSNTSRRIYYPMVTSGNSTRGLSINYGSKAVLTASVTFANLTETTFGRAGLGWPVGLGESSPWVFLGQANNVTNAASGMRFNLARGLTVAHTSSGGNALRGTMLNVAGFTPSQIDSVQGHQFAYRELTSLTAGVNYYYEVASGATATAATYNIHVPSYAIGNILWGTTVPALATVYGPVWDEAIFLLRAFNFITTMV